MKKSGIVVFILLIIAVGVSIYAATRQKKEYKVEEIKAINYHILYKDEKMGVIDNNGDIIIDPIYQYIQIPNPEKDIFVCIEQEKNIVLNSRKEKLFENYDEVSAIPLQGVKSLSNYEKNVLRYRDEDKYGIIDFQGDIVVKAEYDKIESLKYKEGELLVNQNNKVGVINLKGAKIINIEYDKIEGDNFYKDESYAESGYIVCKKTEDGYIYGYFDKNGKEVLKTEYNQINRIIEYTETNDVYLIARKDGRVGTIKNGKTVLEFKFQGIEFNENDNLLVVNKGEKYGVYDLEGKEIIPAQYEELYFRGIYILALDGETETYYDLDGNKKENMKYSGVYKTENSKYYITIDQDSLCGVIGEDGKVEIENSYAYIEYAFDDYFIASKDGTKFGIINNENKVVIDFEYDILSKVGKAYVIQGMKKDENLLELHFKKLQKIYSEQEAAIYVYKDYIELQKDNTIKYFDFEGNSIQESQISKEIKLEEPEKIGKYFKQYYDTGEIYYTDEY